MRKLVVTTFATLDGVMQAPGGPDEDRDGGFEHGGWSVGYWDEMMGSVAEEIHLAAGAVLFGRRTYETLAGYWPHVKLMMTFSKPLNAVILIAGGYILQIALIYFSLRSILLKRSGKLTASAKQ